MTGPTESRWARSAQVVADDLRELARMLEAGELRGVLVVYLEDGTPQKPILEADTEANRKRLERVIYPQLRIL